jgi:RHS repeat-associated protein
VKSVKGASVLADFSYTLDAVGNPTQVVRAGNLPGTTTYGYDARDRLIDVCFQASCPGGSDPFIRWSYDSVGNRLTEQRPAGTTSYSYNAADELTQAGSTAYGYDQNGNETSAGTRTFAYDLANGLKSLTSGSTTTYSYDGEGNRAQQTVGSQVTKFLWDKSHSLPQLALERNGAGTLLRRYLYGLRRVSLSTPTATSYYDYDNLGSVANLTSATGVTQWTYAYEPFGTTRTETQNDASAPQNPLKFTGELLDGTGLYYLRARHYDSATGRFLQPDPVDVTSSSQALSRFVYVADRPTLFVDPSGQTFEPADDAQSVVGGTMSPTEAEASSETRKPQVGGPEGPCRIFVGDPQSYGELVRVNGWQYCVLEQIGTHFYQLCLQYKKKRFLGLFTTWPNIRCSAQQMSGLQLARPQARLEALVTARCKEGKRTYRGISKGSYIGRDGVPRSQAVQSLNYLTRDCP